MVKRIAIGLAVELPILAIPVVAIWGIIRRSQLGRWMGIAALLLLFAAIVLGQMVKPSHANLAEYANDAERAGAMTAKVVMTGLYLALVYRFGFGSKARAYFAPRPEDDDEGTANKYW